MQPETSQRHLSPLPGELLQATNSARCANQKDGQIGSRCVDFLKNRLIILNSGTRASGANEFVAFVTLQCLPEASGAALGVCAPFACSLVQWARQVHRLASGVQALAGEPASVHLFTPCLPPSMADALSDGGRGARVVVHRQHAPRMHAVALQPIESLCLGLPLKRRRSVAARAHLAPYKAVDPHF